MFLLFTTNTVFNIQFHIVQIVHIHFIHDIVRLLEVIQSVLLRVIHGRLRTALFHLHLALGRNDAFHQLNRGQLQRNPLAARPLHYGSQYHSILTCLIARIIHGDTTPHEALRVVRIHRNNSTDHSQGDPTILVVAVLDLLRIITSRRTYFHGNQRIEHAEDALVVAIQVGEDPDAIPEQVAHEENEETDDFQSDHSHQENDGGVEHDVLC